MMNRKVYPSGSRSKPSQNVDLMVQDIDNSIDEITAKHDNDIRNMYAGFNSSSTGNLQNHKNTDGAEKRRHSEVESKSDDGEEVKFSHELLQSENKIADELNDKFGKISEQLSEYRRRYMEANEKLKELHLKLTEAESKAEQSEDENLKLREELKLGGGAGDNSALLKVGVDGGAGVVRVVNRDGLPSQQEIEMNKRSEQIRKALLAGDDDDAVAVAMDDLYKSKNLLVIARGWILLHMPFKRDIRQIQAKFGSSVASYFYFTRFVFLQMCYMEVLIVLFMLLHVISLQQRGKPLVYYIYNGNSFIPRFMSYASFAVSERLAYSSVLMIVLVLTGALLCSKIVTEDRRVKDLAVVDDKHATPHAKEVLCAWDHSLRTRAEVDDQAGNLGNAYLQQLEATRTRGLQKVRSNYDWAKLTARRVFGFYSYLYVLFLSSAAIVYVSVRAQNIQNAVSSYSGLGVLAPFITPVILTFINGVVPILLQYITTLELWDSAHHELNFLLFRIFVSNTLNSAILGLSYLLLVDPNLMADQPENRANLELPFDNVKYECRLDQAADGLFTLVLLTWVLKNATLVGMPLAMRLYQERILRKPWVREEFMVADNMVKQLNFLGLVFMSFPFAPLTTVFLPFFLLINFKWEKYCVKNFYSKPKRVGTGQKAGMTFAVLYVFTFFVQGVCMSGYFLTTVTLPKTCGPFVRSRSAFEPFRSAVLSVAGLKEIWVWLFEYPYVPWVAAIGLAVVLATQQSALSVQKLAAFSRERTMQAHIATIDLERKKQERTIKKLKTIEEGSGEGGGSERGKGDEGRVLSFDGGDI